MSFAIRAARVETTSSVPSTEPPSTTMCSMSGWVWAATESSAPAIVRTLL
jgi:hypothetical protein